MFFALVVLCWVQPAQANLTPIGGEFFVHGIETGVRSEPRVAVAADGRFVVVWQDAGNARVRRFDSAGVAMAQEFTVAAGVVGEGVASVAMGAGGDFVVAWENGRVRAQRFDSTGAVRGGVLAVASHDRDEGEYSYFRGVDVATNDQGEFTVLWTLEAGDPGTYRGLPGTAHHVRGRRYDANGVSGAPFQNGFWDEGFSYSYRTGNPGVAATGPSDFVVVWELYSYFSGYGYDSIEKPAFRVNEAREPSISGAEGRGHVVAWSGGDACDDFGGPFVCAPRASGAFFRRFSSDGVPLGESATANAFDNGTQRGTDVAMASGGDFVVVWSGVGSPSLRGDTQPQAARDIWARAFSCRGQAATPNDLRIEVLAASEDTNPDVAIGDGGIGVVAWAREEDAGSSIVARRFRLDRECFPCGDASMDGILLASDALSVLRGSVDLEECPAFLCDTDADGDVRASDALRVLSRSTGQIVELVCPDPED